MEKAVKMINGSCESEASGGITRDMLKEIASTGVTYISVGALTNSAKYRPKSQSSEIALSFNKHQK